MIRIDTFPYFSRRSNLDIDCVSVLINNFVLFCNSNTSEAQRVPALYSAGYLNMYERGRVKFVPPACMKM